MIGCRYCLLCFKADASDELCSCLAVAAFGGGVEAEAIFNTVVVTSKISSIYIGQSACDLPMEQQLI